MGRAGAAVLVTAAHDRDYVPVVSGVFNGSLDVTVIFGEGDQAGEHVMLNLVCRCRIFHIVGIICLSFDGIRTVCVLQPFEVLDFHRAHCVLQL